MELLITQPDEVARCTLVLAHGAGQPMDAPAMALLAGELGLADVRVVRFEFPNMERRLARGGRGGPRPPAGASASVPNLKSVHSTAHCSEELIRLVRPHQALATGRRP